MKALAAILLFCISGLVYSQAASSQIEVPIVPPKRRALIIGASNYTALGRLSYASSDAERFAAVLTEKYRFGRENIKLINEADASDGKPTIAGIREALSSLLKDPTLNKGDLFILYFSGHGMGTDKGDFLCPTDVDLNNVARDGLPVKEVIQKLVDAGLKNVLILTDACRAGLKNVFGDELIQLGKQANIAVMLGCQPGQKSYESPLLKSGVFTYYLSKALQNPKYRTNLGLVTATDLGDVIKKNVAEFTKKDHGDNFQEPVCETERTRDVVLGAFPSSVNQGEYAPSLREAMQGANLEKVADVCGDLGFKLYHTNRPNEAIDVLKVSEALAPDAEVNQLMLASILAKLGRNGESDRLFRRLIGSKASVVSWYATVVTPSRQVDPELRLKAAKQIWASGIHDENTSIAMWASFRAYGRTKDLDEILVMMSKDLPPASRIGLVAAGDHALISGDLADGKRRFLEALKTPENTYLPNFLLRTALARIYFDLDETDNLISILKLGDDDPNEQGTWKAERAFYLFQMDKREEALAMAISAVQSPDLKDLGAVIAMKAAGFHIDKLADGLAERAKEKPFDWRLQCCSVMATLAKSKDMDTYIRRYGELRKIVDDHLMLDLQLFEIANEMLSDAIQNENAPVSVTDTLYLVNFREWMTRINEFGHNEDPWKHLARIGINIGEGMRAHDVFEKYIGKDCRDSKAGPFLQQARFYLAALAEDEVALKEVVSAEFPEPDKTDVRWLYLTYLYVVGRNGEAVEFAKTIKNAPSERMVTLKEFCDAAAKFLAGDKRALDSIVLNKGDRVIHTVGRQAAAVLLARSGQWDQSLPVLEKANLNTNIILPTTSVYCFKYYVDYLRKQGDLAKVDDAVFESSEYHLGQKTLSGLYWGKSPKDSTYVGSIKGAGKWFGDEQFDQSNPTHKEAFDGFGAGGVVCDIQIESKLILKGTIQVADGESWNLQGTIDEFGCLRGTATSSKSKGSFFARLLPTNFQRTDQKYFQLLSLTLDNDRNVSFVVPRLAGS